MLLFCLHRDDLNAQPRPMPSAAPVLSACVATRDDSALEMLAAIDSCTRTLMPLHSVYLWPAPHRRRTLS